jgi:acetyltransferase-like isoleucine patch superfamily enzyme
VAYEARDWLRAALAWLRHATAVQGRIHWGAVVSIQPGSVLEIGLQSTVERGSILAAKPGNHGPGAIRIGAESWIGEYANLRTEGAELTIGDRCLFGQFVSVIASGHEFGDADRTIAEQGVSAKSGVAIGDDVWIGTHSVVLPGTRIGDGAVVGGGSVVTADVAPYTIVAGNPARVVRARR